MLRDGPAFYLGEEVCTFNFTVPFYSDYLLSLIFSLLSKYIPLTSDIELEILVSRQPWAVRQSSIVVAKFLKKKAVEVEVNSKVKK